MILTKRSNILDIQTELTIEKVTPIFLQII